MRRAFMGRMFVGLPTYSSKSSTVTQASLSCQGNAPGGEYTPRRSFELEEFPLFNDGKKNLAVENRRDTGERYARLLQEMEEGLAIECM